MNDLKFAFRQLLKNPGFTAVAVHPRARHRGEHGDLQRGQWRVAQAASLRGFPIGSLLSKVAQGRRSTIAAPTNRALAKSSPRLCVLASWRWNRRP